MKYNYTVLTIGFLISSSSWAAPGDLFLQSGYFKDPGSSVSIAVDAVNDTIDFLNIRESENVSNDKGDYIGAHFDVQYQLAPEWVIEGNYWYRQIDYSDDKQKLSSPLIALRYTPDFNFNKDNSLTFRLSTWGNFADELKHTNSIGLKTVDVLGKSKTLKASDIQVKNPKDWQLQLDGIFTHKIDHMNLVNVFASFGYSKVSVDQINFRASLNGCSMDMQVQSNNKYTGQLSEKCNIGIGSINNFTVSGDAKEFGLDMNKDLNYHATFASFGGSWNWRYRQFESQLAYQYQRLWRSGVDDNITQYGYSAIKDNHSLGLKLNYDFTPKLRAFIQGEIYKHNLIGTVPFLYNGVTASRLDKKYGLASIGLTYHGF